MLVLIVLVLEPAFPLLGEGAGGGDYVFYFYTLCFGDRVAEHFPFTFRGRVHSNTTFEETHPATIQIYEANFVGFFEGDASVFAAVIGTAPTEVRVVVVRGQVVVAGFDLFV